MLCQEPLRKSGSRWLDRLRTAKGFPSDDATDLAHFLQNPNPPGTIHPGPNPTPNPIHYPTSHGKDQQLRTIVTDVLHELFNFGGGDGSTRVKLKKSARKQANPTICAFHDNAGSGDGNSGVAGVKKRVKNRVEIEEEEESEVNFAGFSKTDVTVIDTSYEVWKSDNWLYRKKDVWRVRDKKVTTTTTTKRESKLSIRKKRKVDESKVGGGGGRGKGKLESDR